MTAWVFVSDKKCKSNQILHFCRIYRMAEPIKIENNVHLEKLLTSNPEMEKEIRSIISTVLRTAVREVQSAASSAIQSDPRGAAKAVRKMVYKQILGGNINILNPRQARGGGSAPASVRGRLARTDQIESYTGADRAFVLRFIDSGTGERTVSHMNGKAMVSGSGRRGKIIARNFFGPAAQQAMSKAVQDMSRKLEQLYQKRINA